jgi:hypothetical protein
MSSRETSAEAVQLERLNHFLDRADGDRVSKKRDLQARFVWNSFACVCPLPLFSMIGNRFQNLQTTAYGRSG